MFTSAPRVSYTCIQDMHILNPPNLQLSILLGKRYSPPPPPHTHTHDYATRYSCVLGHMTMPINQIQLCSWSHDYAWLYSWSHDYANKYSCVRSIYLAQQSYITPAFLGLVEVLLWKDMQCLCNQQNRWSGVSRAFPLPLPCSPPPHPSLWSSLWSSSPSFPVVLLPIYMLSLIAP